MLDISVDTCLLWIHADLHGEVDRPENVHLDGIAINKATSAPLHWDQNV